MRGCDGFPLAARMQGMGHVGADIQISDACQSVVCFC